MRKDINEKKIWEVTFLFPGLKSQNLWSLSGLWLCAPVFLGLCPQHRSWCTQFLRMHSCMKSNQKGQILKGNKNLDKYFYKLYESNNFIWQVNILALQESYRGTLNCWINWLKRAAEVSLWTFSWSRGKSDAWAEQPAHFSPGSYLLWKTLI